MCASVPRLGRKCLGTCRAQHRPLPTGFLALLLSHARRSTSAQSPGPIQANQTLVMTLAQPVSSVVSGGAQVILILLSASTRR